MKEKVPKTVPKFKLAAAPKVKSSSAVLTKFEILDTSILSHVNMLAHMYEQQQLLELYLQGIQKQREELTALIEELKKTKAQEAIFSASKG